LNPSSENPVSSLCFQTSTCTATPREKKQKKEKKAKKDNMTPEEKAARKADKAARKAKKLNPPGEGLEPVPMGGGGGFDVDDASTEQHLLVGGAGPADRVPDGEVLH
jgi:hypothetical protein